MKRYRNIRRIDDASRRTYAWLVQVERRNHIITKMFSDSKFGGKRKALVAARTYRDELVAAVPARNFVDYCEKKRPNNRSGVTGVSRHLVRQRSGRLIPYWYARCPTGIGKTRLVKYSASKHGERGAFELAHAARGSALRDIGDLVLFP